MDGGVAHGALSGRQVVVPAGLDVMGALWLLHIPAIAAAATFFPCDAGSAQILDDRGRRLLAPRGRRYCRQRDFHLAAHRAGSGAAFPGRLSGRGAAPRFLALGAVAAARSEEHTSEL